MSSYDNQYIEHFNQGYENEDNLYFLTERSDNNTELSDNMYVEHFETVPAPSPVVPAVKKRKSNRWLNIFIFFIVLGLIMYYLIDNNMIEVPSIMSSTSNIVSNVVPSTKKMIGNQLISFN